MYKISIILLLVACTIYSINCQSGNVVNPPTVSPFETASISNVKSGCNVTQGSDPISQVIQLLECVVSNLGSGLGITNLPIEPVLNAVKNLTSIIPNLLNNNNASNGLSGLPVLGNLPVPKLPGLGGLPVQNLPVVGNLGLGL